MAINHIQIIYHFGVPKEVTGRIVFNPVYEDLDVILLLQGLLNIRPLVITSLLWDWQTRTLEVCVKEEKAG